MKTFIIIVLSVLSFTVSAQAEIVCQKINSTGRFDNAPSFAKSTNKLLKSKGVKYRTTTKEISNTVKNFCKANPQGTDDDIIKLFVNMTDVLAASGA